MDPITILGGVIVILGALTPIIAKYYYRATVYLGIIKSFLEVINVYYKAKSDGLFDNTEKIEIADKFIALCDSIHYNDFIPAFLKNK